MKKKTIEKFVKNGIIMRYCKDCGISIPYSVGICYCRECEAIRRKNSRDRVNAADKKRDTVSSRLYGGIRREDLFEGVPLCVVEAMIDGDFKRFMRLTEPSRSQSASHTGTTSTS